MANKRFIQRLTSVFGAPAPDTAHDGEKGSVQSLREEVTRLKRAVQELSMLNELTLEIGSTLDPDEIVRKLISRSMRAVNAEEAVVTLVDQTDATSMQTNVRVVATTADRPGYRLNEGLLGWMFIHKQPVVINDPQGQEEFRGLNWDASMRSVICVPLMVKSELIGVLTAYNKKTGEGFTGEDRQLLAIIGGQSAQIIENARQSLLIAGMKEQVRLAYEIQLNLLPKAPPRIAGYDLAGRSVPAQTVGGDYFDFIGAGDDNWAICLGDVSGKGLPASLLMANLQATLRGQTMANLPVSEKVRRANTLMYQSIDDERFVTLFYGMLDLTRNEMTICNAGHESPLHVKTSGDIDRLRIGGLALGVLEEFDYEHESVVLESGESIVVYSDGITDAINKAEETYGRERLESVLRQAGSRSAHEIVDAILSSVNHHAAGATQHDDLTVVVVKRLA